MEPEVRGLEFSGRSESLEETRAWGRALGRTALAGDILLLHGALGAGKTELVRGLAQGVGSEAGVRSPTFNLVHRYDGGRLTLHHLDLYRVEHEEELVELGLDDALGIEGLAAVEWPDRLGEFLPHEFIWLELSLAPDGSRQARWRAQGRRPEEWLRAALDAISPSTSHGTGPETTAEKSS